MWSVVYSGRWRKNCQEKEKPKLQKMYVYIYIIQRNINESQTVIKAVALEKLHDTRVM